MQRGERQLRQTEPLPSSKILKQLRSRRREKKRNMTKTHSRAHIRLENQTDVLNFISTMSKFEDSFSIENANGSHRVNAKSVIGVMYTMIDFPEELYLVNETNNGFIPAFVDSYRPTESQIFKVA